MIIEDADLTAKSLCPLPLLYPSACDFQFRYAPVTVGSGRADCVHNKPGLRVSAPSGRVFKIRLKFGTFFSRIIGLTN